MKIIINIIIDGDDIMKIPDRWFKHINVRDFDFESNDLIEVYLMDKETQEIKNISAIGKDKEGRLFIEIGETL